MANYGIGLGSFMTGFTQGAQAAQGIKDNNRKDKLMEMALQDKVDERNAQQEAKTISAQGVSDANSATDGQINNVMDYYMKNTVPKLQQHWMSNGDVGKAEAFGKWMQQENTQAGMRHGAAMLRSAQMGDADGVMNNMVALYNQPGYFDDGMKAVNAKLNRDKDGNAAGMEITLQNERTGKTSTHTFNSMEDVYNTAMQFASPDKVFDYGIKQLEAGQKVKAETAKEQRAWQRDNAKAERDQGYKLESQNNASQLRRAELEEKNRTGGSSAKVRDAKATIAFLKENGASDDYIKTNMAGILGIENRSRPMSSRIDDYVKMRTDSDRNFRKLSLDDQIKEAQGYIAAVDRQTGENTADTSLGLPAATQQQQGQQQGEGVPYFDTKTGKIVTRPY